MAGQPPTDWETIMHGAFEDSIDLTRGFESIQNSVWDVNLWDTPPLPGESGVPMPSGASSV